MEFCLHKNYNQEVVDWAEAIDNYNYSVCNNEIIKFRAPGFFVIHSADKINKVKNFMQKLNCNVAHCYLNLTVMAETFGRHCDNVDVNFWQCQGKTEWTVDGYGTHILEPGDLIQVPKGIYHSVEALTPRLGISMSTE